MPAIYSAQKLKQLWDLMHAGKSMYEAGKILSIHPDDLDAYMKAAFSKYAEPSLKYRKSDWFKQAKSTGSSSSIQRPKSEYSNKGHWQYQNQVI